MCKMMIIITSGGTSESIDKVREITNNATGRLGAIIAEKTLACEHIDKVIYIHSKKAAMPISNNTEKLIDIQADSVIQVKNAIEKALKENNVAMLIHTMAISDYTVDYISTAESLASDIADEAVKAAGTKSLYEVAKTNIKNGRSRLDNHSKLSSSMDHVVIKLKQAPKIIGFIKKWSPHTKLVGFKLLENVSKNELFDAARKLMQKNKCDYVVANDLIEITEDIHKAYLLDSKSSSVQELHTKSEIASAIVKLI